MSRHLQLLGASLIAALAAGAASAADRPCRSGRRRRPCRQGLSGQGQGGA